MSTITIDLTPEAEAFFLKVTGLKKPDAAVAKYLRNAYAAGKASSNPAIKPAKVMTPAQCQQSMNNSAVKITTKMRKLGMDESFFADDDQQPPTPAQCKRQRAAAKASGIRLAVDPRLARHGITESDLWGL